MTVRYPALNRLIAEAHKTRFGRLLVWTPSADGMRIELRPSNQLGEIMANNGKFQPGLSGNPATQFKPGNRYRWRPGQSGNPAGRPKRAVNVQASLTKTLSEPVLVRIDGKPTRMSSLDAGLLTLRTKAQRRFEGICYLGQVDGLGRYDQASAGERDRRFDQSRGSAHARRLLRQGWVE